MSDDSLDTDTIPPPKGRQRLRVRFRVMLAAALLSIPVSYGLSLVLYDDRNEPYDRYFNGDGPINVTREGVAVKGYDVVAYFTENKPVEGSPKLKASYSNAKFHFASKENRRKFLADPEAYIPAFGGYCSLGVSNGYKDDMHPEAFDIVGGKLYFNLTPGIARSWRRQHEKYIERGNTKWPALRTTSGNGWGDGR